MSRVITLVAVALVAATVAASTAQADARTPKVDPLAVGYLMGRGLTPSEVRDWTTGACSHESKPASCFAALDRGSVAVSSATAPSSAPAGFDWGDAGIGAGAGLGIALLLVGMGMAFVISRHNRRRHVVGA